MLRQLVFAVLLAVIGLVLLSFAAPYIPMHSPAVAEKSEGKRL
jgi:hypothetical protein